MGISPQARALRRAIFVTFSALALTGVAAIPSALAASTHTAANSSHSQSPASDHKATGTSGTSGTTSQPQPTSNADKNTGGANGQCPGGAYCSTRHGKASGNGSGGGKATGRPCAGCVGKADNKNPPGQAPNGTDANAGYECDRNHGIGRTNPAHTGCATGSTTRTDCSATPTAPGCVATGTNCITTPAASGCVTTGGENCTTLPDLPQCVTAGAHCAATVGSNCTSVLGIAFTRTPTTTGPPVEVLGDTVTHTPAASLPFTGVNAALMMVLALITMVVGGVLTVAARRRSV